MVLDQLGAPLAGRHRRHPLPPMPFLYSGRGESLGRLTGPRHRESSPKVRAHANWANVGGRWHRLRDVAEPARLTKVRYRAIIKGRHGCRRCSPGGSEPLGQQTRYGRSLQRHRLMGPHFLNRYILQMGEPASILVLTLEGISQQVQVSLVHAQSPLAP